MNALEANGSPKPEFETDEDRSYFIARLFIHEKFVDDFEEGPKRSQKGAEKRSQKKTSNTSNFGRKSDNYTDAAHERMNFAIQNKKRDGMAWSSNWMTQPHRPFPGYCAGLFQISRSESMDKAIWDALVPSAPSSAWIFTAKKYALPEASTQPINQPLMLLPSTCPVPVFP